MNAEDDDKSVGNDNDEEVADIREDGDAIASNGYSMRDHERQDIDTTGAIDGEAHHWGHEQDSMGYVFQLDEGKDNLDTIEQLCIDKSGSCGTNVYATPSRFFFYCCNVTRPQWRCDDDGRKYEGGINGYGGRELAQWPTEQ